MSIATNRGLGRTMSLDGLRGVAALMVFVHHAQLPGLGQVGPGLDAGVMLFFGLSGYVLFEPLVERQGDVVAYALRRTLRILPAYLVAALAVSALWQPTYLSDPRGLVTLQHTPILVAWTLSIEIAFYIAVPFMALALRRVRRPALWIAWGAVVSLGLALLEMQITKLTPIGFHAWAWAFAPGMLVALPRVRARLASIPTMALGLVMIGISVALDLPFPDLPAAVGAGLLIASLLGRPSFGGRVAVALGALSYSVYLWHLPVLDALDRPPSWTGAAVALAVTIAISTAVFLLVERPAIRLGRRITLARSTRAQVETEAGWNGHARARPPDIAPDREAAPTG